MERRRTENKRVAQFAVPSSSEWWTHPVVPGTLVFLLLYIIAAFFPRAETWGVAHWSGLTWTARVLLLVIGSVLCFPFVARSFSIVLHRIKWSKGLSILIVAAAALCFVLFRVGNNANGDGYFFLTHIDSRSFPAIYDQLYAQLGDIFVHWGIAQWVMIPLGLDITWAYVTTAVIAGVAGLGALLYFARQTQSSREGQLFILFGALTAAPVYFWFGHVESYTLTTVCGLWACVLAAAALSNRRHLTLAWVFLALAVLFHLVSLTLLPAIAYASLTPETRKKMVGFRSPALNIFLGWVGIGVLVSIMNALGRKFFVPILPTDTNSYSAFSIEHLLDVVNATLRASPLFFVALVFWLSRKSRVNDHPRPIQTLLAIAATGTLYFVFWIDPSLGAARDWDLLALAGFPLTLSALTFFADRETERKGFALKWVPLAVLACANVGVLVAINRNPDKGAETLNDLLADDVHYSTHYYSGSRLMPWGTILFNDLNRPDLAVEYFRRRTEVAPDESLAWTNFAFANYKLGHARAACQALERVLRIDSTNYPILNHLGTARLMMRDWGKARLAFERKLTVTPGDGEALFGAGLAFAYLGDYPPAIPRLEKAIAVAIAGTTQPFIGDRDSLVSYARALAVKLESRSEDLEGRLVAGLLHFLSGNSDAGLKSSRITVNMNPQSIDAHRLLALGLSASRLDIDALNEWKWCNGKRPLDALNVFLMGIVAMRVDELNLAIDCFESAADSSPRFAAPCKSLIEIYDKLNDPANARAWAREYVKRNPVARDVEEVRKWLY